MFSVFFNQVCFNTTPGNKFKPYTSGTGKKVQYFDFFQIIIINQNVKQTFFGRISGWSCPEIFRRIEMPALVCATYDTQ